MAADLNQEVDAMLQMMEEMVKIMLRLKEEHNQNQVVAGNGLRQQSQAGAVPADAAEADATIAQLDEKMKGIGVIKGDIAHKLEQENLQNTTRVIKNEQQSELVATNSHDASQDAISSELQNREEIRKTFNNLKRQFNDLSKEMDQLDFRNPSALARFGQSLIALDQQIKTLSNRITDFVKSVPENAKVSAITFCAVRLDTLAQSITDLKDKLNAKILVQSNIAAKSEKLPQSSELPDHLAIQQDKKQEAAVNAKEQTPFHVLPQKEKSEMGHTTNSKTAKDLLSVVEEGEFYTMKDLVAMNMSSDLNAMGDSIEECSRKAIEANNFIGLQTEIDPNVTSLESMAGNEQSGIRTVPSVKDELEDITLSEYSDDMEAAYQNGFDTDPNIATAVTDEEWANQHDEEYANQQPERMVFDPWEQER